MNRLREALAARMDPGIAGAVSRTLTQLCADAMGCAEDDCSCAPLPEEAAAYSFSSDHAWVAVVLVHTESEGLAAVAECADQIPPPERTVVVSLGARTTRLRAAPGVTVFEAKELAYNPTKHSEASKMTRLTPDQAEALLVRTLRVPPSAMPVMGINDIVARYYGYARGDVVRCDRTTPSGTYTFYRVVA